MYYETIQQFSTMLSGLPALLDKAAAYAEQRKFDVANLLTVGSSRVDLQACKLEYSIVSPK